MMSRRRPLSLTCVAASKPPIQNESKTWGGFGGLASGAMRQGFLPCLARDPGVHRQGLSHDLVHVVVLVRRQAPHEMDSAGGGRQHLVLPVQLGIFTARNGIVRIA